MHQGSNTTITEVVGSSSNHRIQRTHSRVTPLAEDRKRRATRRAADAERYADKSGHR
jgi:hypothetical protein